MSAKSRIREGLMSLFKQANPSMSAFSAEVLSVDIANRTCSVRGISDETGTEYPNVWLMPEVADGLLYVPKVGSTVIVENNASLQPYVVMWSELDKVLYIVNNTTFSITDGLTQFNKGENDGLVNVKPLTDKINNLEKLLNDLINKYNAHTHIGSYPVAGGGGGTAGGTSNPTLSTESGTISPLTTQGDIEDKDVTH